MTPRIPKVVAAAVTVAYLSALAGPALASGGDDGPEHEGEHPSIITTAPAGHHDGPSSTLNLPTATSPTAPSSSTRPAGVEVIGYLDSLAAALRANPSIAPATRDALLNRIAEARTGFQTGHPPTSSAMQTLVREVKAALGGPRGGDDHGSTTSERPETDRSGGDGGRGRGNGTPSTVAGAVTGNQGPGGGDRHPGQEEILRLLASVAAKVDASSLADADKQALLDKITAVRAKLATGQPLGPEELGQLMTAVRTALGGADQPDHPEHPPVSHPEDAGKDPGQRALAEIDRQIAKVEASNLPEDVKAQVLAALNEAKTKVAAGAAAGEGAEDAGEAARHAIEDHRQARMEQLRARLSAAADRIEARIATLAGDPANQALVEQTTAELAQARDQLAAATTPEDFRAVWGQLRHIRLELRAVEQPTTTTTAAEPGTTETTAVEPSTTETTAVEPSTTETTAVEPSTTETTETTGPPPTAALS